MSPPGRHAADRALARGVLLIGLFALAAGLARLGQDIAIAWRHGTGPEVDAYQLLLGLAQWPAAVALSTLTALVAPTESALPGGAGARQQLRGELLGAMLALAAASALVAAVAMAWASTRLPPEAAAAARAGLPAMALVVGIGLLGALVSAWWVAEGRATLTLVEAALPLAVLAALVLAPAIGLFQATLLGAGLQLALLAVGLAREGRWPRPRWRRASPGWSGLGRGALALLAGQMLFAMIPLVDLAFAAGLGAGQLAALGFASRLLLGVQGLAGVALQRAALPLLTGMADDPAAATRAVWRWAGAALALGCAAALLLALTADALTRLLFERGRFDAADREAVATLLQAGALQLPPYFAGLVLTTALVARGHRTTLAGMAALGFAVKILASAWLVPAAGAAGLMASTAVVYVITTSVAAARWGGWRAPWRRPV